LSRGKSGLDKKKVQVQEGSARKKVQVQARLGLVFWVAKFIFDFLISVAN
jgi:hypothetical protein